MYDQIMEIWNLEHANNLCSNGPPLKSYIHWYLAYSCSEYVLKRSHMCSIDTEVLYRKGVRFTLKWLDVPIEMPHSAIGVGAL